MRSVMFVGRPEADRMLARSTISGEAVSLALIGSIVGIVVGMLTAGLFAIMWQPGFDGEEGGGVVLAARLAAVIVFSIVLLVSASILFSHLGARTPGPRSTSQA